LVEEALCGSVWTTAATRVQYLIKYNNVATRSRAITGHITCMPHSTGAEAANGIGLRMKDLPSHFEIAFVGEGDVLGDLQRNLKYQNHLEANTSSVCQLPVVRRDAVASMRTFREHYRIGRTGTFMSADAIQSWADLCATLPEFGIPDELLCRATRLTAHDVAQQTALADGYVPAQSARSVLMAGEGVAAATSIGEATADAPADTPDGRPLACLGVDSKLLVLEVEGVGQEWRYATIVTGRWSGATYHCNLALGDGHRLTLAVSTASTHRAGPRVAYSAVRVGGANPAPRWYVWPLLTVGMETAGLVDVTQSVFDLSTHMTAACANLLSATGSSTGTVYLHRHRQELLGSFKNPRLYEEAHVSLFPCARGGPGTESDSSASQWDTVRRAARFTPSSFDCDVEHQLKHYTSAFELHKTYIFVVWNISTRHQILQRANLTAGRRPDLDIEQLASEMAQFVTSGARRPSSGSSVQALYRDCDAVGRDVKGSPYERKAFRTPLFGFDVEFGVKNLFVTLSPADCYDLRVAIANEEPMFRTIEWRQQSTWPAAVRIYEAMASRPATAARYHARLFHAYLRAFVGWLYTQGRSGRRVASAVFGKVKAFGGMVETQSRGSEHIHLSLHVAASCVQYLRERLGHAERRKQLFEYLDSVVDCCVPSALLDWHQQSAPVGSTYPHQYDSKHNPPSVEWRNQRAHVVRGFDADADIKYVPPQDARLRPFDVDAFQEETRTRYALSVSTGSSQFHYHTKKCWKEQAGGVRVCKSRFRRPLYTHAERDACARGEVIAICPRSTRDELLAYRTSRALCACRYPARLCVVSFGRRAIWPRW
jgi:hypothetical protein